MVDRFAPDGVNIVAFDIGVPLMMTNMADRTYLIMELGVNFGFTKDDKSEGSRWVTVSTT